MRILLGSFLLFASACATHTISVPIGGTGAFEVSEADFPDLDACFLLYSLKDSRFLKVYGEERCKVQMPPCSTFKVPLAVIGFESGKLIDENTFFHWDGKDYPIDAWNRNQTARTWMRDSVVWVSQILALNIGAKKIEGYLEDFSYGNKDFSGGTQGAWLTPAPFLLGVPNTSLKISAFEQMDFMKKLWRDELPVTFRAMKQARDLTRLETSPNGTVLHGKTGSGFVGADGHLRLACLWVMCRQVRANIW